MTTKRDLLDAFDLLPNTKITKILGFLDDGNVVGYQFSVESKYGVYAVGVNSDGDVVRAHHMSAEWELVSKSHAESVIHAPVALDTNWFTVGGQRQSAVDGEHNFFGHAMSLSERGLNPIATL